MLSKYFGRGKYLKFDKIKFAKNIAKKQGLFVKHIFYATAPPFQGTPPTDDERRRKIGYDRFKNNFANRKDFTILEGRVQRLKLPDGTIKYSQKGVDTILTMSLGSVPSDFPEIKKIILVACDTDFYPIIKKLRSKGIEVILYSYYEKKRNTEFSRSHHLIDCSSKYVLLTKQDFENAPIIKSEKQEK